MGQPKRNTQQRRSELVAVVRRALGKHGEGKIRPEGKQGK